MKTLFSIGILFLVPVALMAQQPYAPRLVMYAERNEGGEYLIVPHTYVPDLRVQNFDDRTLSVCAIGLWMMYVNYNYNENNLSGVEFVFGRGPLPTCTPFNLISLGGYVSSIRFVGSAEDYRSDSFTLFQEDWFQGQEEYLTVDTPSLGLAGNHKSIVITGMSAFTIFDQVNYAGNSICLYPPGNNEPYLIENVLDEIDVPYGAIRSIRKGCVSTNKLTPTEFNAQGSNFHFNATAHFGQF